jgi:predicted DNA-binding transcriptional regulator YafY
MTASQLAAELEVSVRTVHRDVEALAEAGVPIYAERGPQGGVRLVEGYRTRLTGLTTEEAEALFLSGVPGPAAELGLGTVVAAARLKVLAALPPELRARATRISERFHLDAPGWFKSSDPLPHLGALANAVWESQRVSVVYRKPEGAVTRELDPLGLVLKAGVWYLVGRHAGQIRTYRVSRVLAATQLPGHFDRPPDFDLATHWATSIAAYEQEHERVDVVLRVAADGLERVLDLAGERLVGTPTTAPDGSVRVRIRFEWWDDAVAAAVWIGGTAEVVEPVRLRRSIVKAARAILDHYETEAEPEPAAG